VAVKMHHGKDQNFIALHRVNNSIGKAVRPATANLFVQREPCRRMHENAADCGTNFLQEIKSETRNAVFVILRRFPQFPPRRPQEPEFHCLNSSSMARNASSPLMAVS